MATIAEFSVQPEAFPLGRVLAGVSGAVIELERIVPTGDSLCPYLWIRGVSPATVEAAVATADPIAQLSLVDDLGTRGMLFRAIWIDDDGLMRALVDAPITLLSGCYRDGSWTIRIRADEHDDVSTFRQRCQENDVAIALTRLQPLTLTGVDPDTELTRPQLEALELAFDRGYFDDARQVTLDELATELSITRQSFAGRLRRGHRNLLTQLFESSRRERLDSGIRSID